MGRPDDALLCYVELRGAFEIFGPQGATISYQRMAEVFDAHTGNLLAVAGVECKSLGKLMQ
jgi:hypothetical protein